MFSKIIFVYFYTSGVECQCGNTLSYPNLTSICDKPCSGNTADTCGDTTGQYFSIYASYSSKSKLFPFVLLLPNHHNLNIINF